MALIKILFRLVLPIGLFLVILGLLGSGEYTAAMIGIYILLKEERIWPE